MGKHDFKKHPELTNSQMPFYIFKSPHKQIVEDFRGEVVRVIDGDTVEMKVNFRDFLFPVRLANIAAPELSEVGGIESKKRLESKVLGKRVNVLIDPKNRVGKFGRLIGDIIRGGQSMSELMLRERRAKIFGQEEWL